MKNHIDDQLKRLREIIGRKESLAVAFSGGIDSSLIAKVAHDLLGDRAIAVTVDSDTLSRRELEQARRTAAEIGIRHQVVRHSELENPIFRENPPHRCYHCKKEEIACVAGEAARHGINTIAFGVNYSDHNEHRPGITALKEGRYFLPLEEAGIGKDIIPELARRVGLSNYRMPSTTCLASRIPYGNPISADKLRQVEQAEAFLYSLGISLCRVRHHGQIARIEVPEPEIRMVFDHRNQIHQKLHGLGFSYVTLDLKGYRSGSMDEIL
jgi:uncharacterized protein